MQCQDAQVEETKEEGHVNASIYQSPESLSRRIDKDRGRKYNSRNRRNTLPGRLDPLTPFDNWRDGNLNKIGIVFIGICLLTVLAAPAAASEAKALFFEAGVPAEQTTLSTESAGFSKLGEVLGGIDIRWASMSSGKLTAEILSAYEIVVLHPSGERPLGKGEISALAWFVTRHGGSLLVHGGTSEIVNPLIELFGISMDSSNLIDVSSPIGDGSGGRQFVLRRFPKSESYLPPEDKIETIGFYGGPPLVLSADATAVVTGGDSTYSDNGLYSIGSLPPVAAMAFFGKGIVLVKSDRAMLNNENIGMYNNTEWAMAVFKGLEFVRKDAHRREESLLGLRSKIGVLRKRQESWSQERIKNETDLATSFEKAQALEREIQKATARSENLNEELIRLAEQADSSKKRLALYEGPDTWKTAAMIVGATLLVVFLFGFYFGRRRARPRV
jgi:hypothetical protein